MKSKLVVATGLVILLSFLCIKTTFAKVSLASVAISYTASEGVSHYGPIVQMSYSVNATLDCAVAYSCLTEGSLPQSLLCHLNVTPNYAQLTVDYHIERYLKPNLDGFKQVQLSIGQLSGLIGASSPINIPIGSDGNISITIQGTILGQNLTVTPQGSADPNSVQWSAWTPQDTLVSSINSQATLKIDTEYQVSFIVVVYMVGFESVRTDSALGRFLGNTSPAFAIPEFQSALIVPLFIAVTLLASTVYTRKRTRARANQELILKSKSVRSPFLDSNRHV